MSKLVNEMLIAGDNRLVKLLVDGNVVEHKKDDFHSFYSPYGAEGNLDQISDWGYNQKIGKKSGTMYGLVASDEFVSKVPVDTSAYLFANGFVLDGGKWKKETEKGSISEDGFPGCHQRLFWNIVMTNEDGESWNDKIHLTVTNSEFDFLPVLDQLLSLDPVKDCGLDARGRSYRIRYERGSIGLYSLDGFIDHKEVIRHAKLFKAIERIR